ncbi:hypothetical protein LCGC14_3121610, partial [marine sediment metagenome]
MRVRLIVRLGLIVRVRCYIWVSRIVRVTRSTLSVCEGRYIRWEEAETRQTCEMTGLGMYIEVYTSTSEADGRASIQASVDPGRALSHARHDTS